MPDNPDCEQLGSQLQELEKESLISRILIDALRESVAHYRTFFEKAPIGIFLSTLEGKFIDVNPFLAGMLGYESPSQLILEVNKKNIGQVLYEKDEKRSDILKEVLQQDQWCQYENRYVCKDGKILTAHLMLRAVRCKDGSVSHLEGFVEDITQRKMAEEALGKSYDDLEKKVRERTVELENTNVRLKKEIDERVRVNSVLRRYQKIIDTVRDPISYVNNDLKFDYVNEAYCDFVKKPSSSIIGKTIPEIIGKTEYEKKIKSHIKDCLEGKHKHFQDWFNLPGENRVFMDIRGYPLFDASMTVKGIVFISRDITDVKQTEAKLLKKSHELSKRVKELNCLYIISKLLEEHDISLEQMCQKLVNIIPYAWQYPSLTCARLLVEDKAFKTINYRKTPWKQCIDIDVNDRKIGVLEIYYLEEMPISDEGPFLKEERYLMTVIAEHLQRAIKHRRMDEALKITNRKMQEEHAQRKALSKMLIDLLERDRYRIAMELHDQIGQVITSLKMDLELVLDNLRNEDREMIGRLTDARDKAIITIKSLKNVSHGLMPAVLNDLGLIPSLREFFNDIQKKVDFRIHFFSKDVPGRFGREKELAVYRIVQESITNIIKHSMAKQVHVNLFHKSGKLSLSVEDDGVGFEKHSKLFMNRKRRQLGLLIMKERTIQLGGEFYIESEVNKGTHILAEIPLDLSSDEADTQKKDNP